MPIPKIVHSIWFGRARKPALVERCQESWRKCLPDYRFIEWSEANWRPDDCAYARDMFDRKAWAFLSDVVRLQVLREHGGIYLDADMFLHKPLDRFLHAELFMSFGYDCALQTALIGAASGHRIIADLHEFYRGYTGGPIINNTPLTWYFIQHVPGFRLTGQTQQLADGIHIFDRKYLASPTYDRAKGYATHLAMGSWSELESARPRGRMLSKLKRAVRQVLGPVLYEDLRLRYAMPRVEEFYPTYLLHKRGERGIAYPVRPRTKKLLELIDESSCSIDRPGRCDRARPMQTVAARNETVGE